MIIVSVLFSDDTILAIHRQKLFLREANLLSSIEQRPKGGGVNGW